MQNTLSAILLIILAVIYAIILGLLVTWIIKPLWFAKRFFSRDTTDKKEDGEEAKSNSTETEAE